MTRFFLEGSRILFVCESFRCSGHAIPIVVLTYPCKLSIKGCAMFLVVADSIRPSDWIDPRK